LGGGRRRGLADAGGGERRWSVGGRGEQRQHGRGSMAGRLTRHTGHLKDAHELPNWQRLGEARPPRPFPSVVDRGASAGMWACRICRHAGRRRPCHQGPGRLFVSPAVLAAIATAAAPCRRRQVILSTSHSSGGRWSPPPPCGCPRLPPPACTACRHWVAYRRCGRYRPCGHCSGSHRHTDCRR